MLPYLTSCCYDNNIDENQSVSRATTPTATAPSLHANSLLSEQMTNMHLTKAHTIEHHSNQMLNTTDCSKNNNNYTCHNNTNNNITINSKLHIDQIQVISWWQTFLPYILNILQVS
ncbi:unnamed protein product [Trichobilharzia regenti]|nr:unnamed protein product [Trichobilharzia regenti]